MYGTTDTNQAYGTTIPLDTNQDYGTAIPLDTNQAYGTTTHLDTNQAYGTTIPLDTNQAYGTTIPLDTIMTLSRQRIIYMLPCSSKAGSHIRNIIFMSLKYHGFYK